MRRLGTRVLGLTSAIALAATIPLVAPAIAADAAFPDVAANEAHDLFDIAFGATVTTDYIWRGVTQTDHRAAIQGYVEPSFGIVYLGIWASNVAFGGETDLEYDLYAGIRPEFGLLSLDLGYNHAYYANDPESDSGEFFAKAFATVAEPLTIGAAFHVNPDDSATYVEANGDLTLPNNFGLSGAVGAISGETSYSTWNAGIYYAVGEWGTVDLRYSDTSLSTDECFDMTGLTGNECDGRVMLSFSVDTSVSALKGE